MIHICPTEIMTALMVYEQVKFYFVYYLDVNRGFIN